MFRTFQLTFDEDILAFFGLALVLAIFSKIWVISFPQISGHTTCTVSCIPFVSGPIKTFIPIGL
jgi:hypothetical protein